MLNYVLADKGVVNAMDEITNECWDYMNAYLAATYSRSGYSIELDDTCPIAGLVPHLGTECVLT